MAESFAMKKSLLLVLAALMLSSCGGPEEGPLGIHVGDKIGPSVYEAEVTAVGKDWIEVRGDRRSARSLESVRVNCPHK